MLARSLMLAVAFVIGLWASRAGAGDEVHCLDKEQQRAAIASGKAVHLAQALRATGGRNPGEVVKIRLCETPKGLVYRLTVLAPNGKVTRVNVDAASGHVVGGL